MKANREVYRTALGYLKLAELAEEMAVEVNSFRFAYNSNLAFSIELFIKSIMSLSEDRIVFEIGSAQITKKFASSSLRGHGLGSLFKQLPKDRQYELSTLFFNHQCNVACESLELILSGIESSFVDNRYVYEKGGMVSANESDLLLWTARFFREVLSVD
ncbi:hypothetical protein G5S52_09730 [Grimontia sp. S25]|uniref:HEPN domain-containing protein n=1 Tax=Grimontia sedimenti TaxID=2711294 RepID=A0A6M1RCA2_9GAMM|nr:hypothetical protein [Grimontia sedimenti]NGN97924.1 hypothetical protein [Grimontia sedimenti]